MHIAKLICCRQKKKHIFEHVDQSMCGNRPMFSSKIIYFLYIRFSGRLNGYNVYIWNKRIEEWTEAAIRVLFIRVFSIWGFFFSLSVLLAFCFAAAAFVKLPPLHLWLTLKDPQIHSLFLVSLIFCNGHFQLRHRILKTDSFCCLLKTLIIIIIITVFTVSFQLIHFVGAMTFFGSCFSFIFIYSRFVYIYLI